MESCHQSAGAGIAGVRLARRDDLGAGYFVLGFEGAEVRGEAGQFAMVRAASWAEVPLLSRPMSLLATGAALSMLIKVVGEGTRRMATGPIGEAYTLLAPLGRPWPRPAPAEAPLLVAGGVGVAPLLYLARELAARGQNVWSLYGGRTHRDLPLSAELEACGRLDVTTEDGSRGVRGRVTLLLERALDELGDGAVVYTCGPHAMMGAVAAVAEAHGVRCHASLEAPMGCGYGVCLGCPVQKRGGGYLYTCVDGPCVDAAEVEWSGKVF